MTGPRAAVTDMTNPLGLAGSAFGSLAARVIRDSLHSYWHGGQSAAQSSHDKTTKEQAKTPPPEPPGIFARRSKPAPPGEDVSWLDKQIVRLAELEAGRTKRNSPFPTSDAHRRFLNASASWRLRIAYELDPGDPVLYEILHYQLAARLAEKPETRQKLDALAERAITHGTAPMSGLNAALAGAGAALNLLNDLLRPGQPKRDDDAIIRRWGQLDRCLARYRAIRHDAVESGWWSGIPEVRQQELEQHAALLGRIAEKIRLQLPAARLTVQIQHRWHGAPLPLAKPGLLNAAGDKLSVTRLAYLLSKAMLRTESGEWISAGDWFAFLDVEKDRTHFTLPRVPRGRYTALRFDLGLDEQTDKSDPARWPAGHPLNPDLNALHWSWKDGYVFLAIEGHYERPGENPGGYSYHLAGQDCAGTIEVPVEMDLNGDLRLTLAFDTERVFAAAHTIRIPDSDSTHSHDDGGLAARMADNAVQAFALLGIQPDLQNTGPAELVGSVNAPPTLAGHVPAHFPLTTWPEDNTPTPDGVALGRRLFEDKRLSINNTQSCSSCHHQQAAFAEPLATSTGAQGQTGARNAMPLFNLAWKPSFFWDGRSPTLRDQVLRPIQDPLEMNETLPGVIAKLRADPGTLGDFEKAFGTREITPERIALALEQFLLTFISGQSRLDLARAGKAELTEQEQHGFRLFFTESDPARGIRGADCFHCHGGAHFTNNQFHNNGLDPDDLIRDIGREKVTGKPGDKGKFMTPSLRNAALTAPYMHDGRFKTLEEVVDHYDRGIKSSSTLDPNLAKHLTHGGLGLTPEEKAALVAFLKTLTDTSFTEKPSVMAGVRTQ
ncbi:MAG TPA: cytochrome c peroxidase [Prosthecobacter sp.]|nr:cytochrome c peroxidase [Prosthecobacter sp.]